MTRPQTSASRAALTQDLIRLAAIPSISAPGYPESTHAALGEAYELVAELLRDAGLQNVAPLELPGTAPAVTGEIPADYGQGFGVTARFRTPSVESPVLRLLWTNDGGAWRITVHDVELP